MSGRWECRKWLLANGMGFALFPDTGWQRPENPIPGANLPSIFFDLIAYNMLSRMWPVRLTAARMPPNWATRMPEVLARFTTAGRSNNRHRTQPY
jgi:hypothetical protein